MDQSRRAFIRLTALGAAACLPISCSGLTRGSDPDAETFLDAVRSGRLDEVRRRVESDASLVRVVDAQGRSAFAIAHLHGHAAVAGYLADAGHTIDLHEAALAQDWARFEALAATPGADVNGPHPIGGSAMFAAAAGGAGSNMWRVYAAIGDPNAMPVGHDGASPLQAALRYRDLPTAEMTAATLLGNAADPNPASRVEDPPLHIAAGRGSVEMVEMLIRHRADLSARDRQGRTAIQVAGEAGHAVVVSLLEGEAGIPRTHSTSRTAWDALGRPYAPPALDDLPLMDRRTFVGQSHGNLEYVTEAIARDGRLAHSVATDSEISVEACAHTGQRPIVEFLLEHGAPYSLPTAVMRNDTRRVNELLNEDPLRIHERGAHDFALLWYPVIGRCPPEMTELLLARGADIEEQHFLGTTALHWACRRGPIEVVDLLIAAGADLNRRGRKFGPDGATPLETAREAGQDAIARLLVDRGAAGN